MINILGSITPQVPLWHGGKSPWVRRISRLRNRLFTLRGDPLTQLAQFEASFWILSRVALNQIKELSAQKCLHRHVVTTKVVDVSR